ncbi:AIG2 multi-domain protein [Pyrenophora tritici-repentis]|nr:AIG2 multi-domain protein [Pyrenophora tritici-repentis]
MKEQAVNRWQPQPMFFYGTLQAPEILAFVLNLQDLLALKPATIKGYKMKMIGVYPTLIPNGSEEDIVQGFVWDVQTEEMFERLVEYETDMYKWEVCKAETQGRQEETAVVEDCRVFIWGGEKDSALLQEGTFDLGDYKRKFWKE